MTQRDYQKIDAAIIQPNDGQEHDAGERSQEFASSWPPSELVKNLAEKAAFKFERREHEFGQSQSTDLAKGLLKQSTGSLSV